MTPLEFPCPQCGKTLKLPDRSMLGRKCRCGKCGHKFISSEPGPPVLAEAPAPTTGQMQFEPADELPVPDSDKTLMGISARYIPEGHGAQSALPTAVRAPAPPPPAAPAVDQILLPEMLLEEVNGPEADAISRVRKKRE